MLEHFIDCIEGKSKCIAGKELCYKVASWLEACRKSELTNKKISI